MEHKMATNGFDGNKLEFRCSKVKKNTEFYKKYIAGTLTEENLKWSECPYKFLTKNHFVGSINSPQRSENEYSEHDAPKSPASLSPELPESRLINDMVAMLKRENLKGLKCNTMKEETSIDSVRLTPSQYHPCSSFMPTFIGMNQMHPMMQNMHGMPLHSSQVWGGATPMNSAAQTPSYSGYHNSLSIVHDIQTNKPKNDPRTRPIPLESDFNVEHNDPRPQPIAGPRKVLSLNRVSSNARFIETYKQTNRFATADDSGACRIDYSNHPTERTQSALKQRKIQTQETMKSASIAVNEESDTESSPIYEPVLAEASAVNFFPSLSSLSEDNDSAASNVTVEFQHFSSDSSSKFAKKRRRSRSAAKRQDNKKQKVSPIIINHKSGTVKNKDKKRDSARVVQNKENIEKNAPETSTYVPPAMSIRESSTLDDPMGDLFPEPIRTSQSLPHNLDKLLSGSPSLSSDAEQPDQTDEQTVAKSDDTEMIEMIESVLQCNYGTEINQIAENCDEMAMLKVSQSASEMSDGFVEQFDVSSDNVSATDGKLDESDYSDDDSDADEMMMERLNNTLPPNTHPQSNQVNASTKSQCTLCTYHTTHNAKKLVAHYINVHPDNEVYISRLTESYSENVKRGTFAGVVGDKETPCQCPFCDELLTMSAKRWITHFTEHTGEFEYVCTKCTAKCRSKSHGKCNGARADKVIEHTIENGALRAFMCEYCNFAQLSKDRVEKHISKEHQMADNLLYLCIDFTLFRLRNENAATETVTQGELTSSSTGIPDNNLISILSEESQNAAQLRYGKPKGITEPSNVHNTPPQDLFDDIENTNELEKESVAIDRMNVESVLNKEADVQGELNKSHDNVKVEAEVADEIDNHAKDTDGVSAPTATTVPDSKSASDLVAAKAQFPTDISSEKRTFDSMADPIEISSDESEEDLDADARLAAKQISCYSVVTSDEED